jgi:hypothetical protein
MAAIRRASQGLPADRAAAPRSRQRSTPRSVMKREYQLKKTSSAAMTALVIAIA